MPVTIHLSKHAIHRFQERVRPALDDIEAEDELARLVLAAELTAEPPAWHLAGCAQLAPFYLVIADMVLPLKQSGDDPEVLVATTCLARGDRSAATRERVRRRRAEGRFRRRGAAFS